jgi:uncharacterized tellurite resistance protein B-like protein
LLRFLGLGGPGAGPEARGSQTVQRIAAQLDRLPPETARFLAAFAYVLSRVAHADLDIDDAETAEMERRVAEVGGLEPEHAGLAVEIAKAQTHLHGSTQNYVVTREFREISSVEERRQLIACLFAVAAADGTVSSAENDEIKAIGDELGLARGDVAAVRSLYRDKLAVLQGMPGR